MDRQSSSVCDELQFYWNLAVWFGCFNSSVCLCKTFPKVLLVLIFIDMRKKENLINFFHANEYTYKHSEWQSFSIHRRSSFTVQKTWVRFQFLQPTTILEQVRSISHSKMWPLREVVKPDFCVAYIADPIFFVQFLPNTFLYLSVLLNTPQSDCLP